MVRASSGRGISWTERKQLSEGSVLHKSGFTLTNQPDGFSLEPTLDSGNGESIEYYRNILKRIADSAQRRDPIDRCECSDCQKLVWMRGILNLKFCSGCNHHHFNREPCPRCGQRPPETKSFMD